MKLLFVCESVFQLIVALKIRRWYENAEMSIVLTDMIPNAEIYVEKLKIKKLFQDVAVFEYRYNNIFNSRSVKLQRIFSKFDYLSEVGRISCNNFDVILGGTIYGPIEIYFNRNKEKDISVYLIQDGNYNYCVSEINKLFSPTLKVKFLHDILKKVKGQYVFHSEFGVTIEGKFQSINIPGLSDQDKNLLNYVFGFYNKKKYNKRLIFIDQAFEELGVNMDEVKYVHILENIMGPENIAIKLHPRTDEKKYIGVNCEIIEDRIPLELMVLNNCAIEMLVSVSSSAGLMPSLCMERRISSVFLYKLEKDKHEKVMDYYSLDEMILNITKKYPHIKAVNSLLEFEEIIKIWK